MEEPEKKPEEKKQESGLSNVSTAIGLCVVVAIIMVQCNMNNSSDTSRPKPSIRVPEIPTSGANSESTFMDFNDCVRFIDGFSNKLRATPTTLVDTDILKMVKFFTADGGVLISCSRPDGKMVITVSKD